MLHLESEIQKQLNSYSADVEEDIQKKLDQLRSKLHELNGTQYQRHLSIYDDLFSQYQRLQLLSPLHSPSHRNSLKENFNHRDPDEHTQIDMLLQQAVETRAQVIQDNQMLRSSIKKLKKGMRNMQMISYSIRKSTYYKKYKTLLWSGIFGMILFIFLYHLF
eukprot:NODE_130_length_18488_cov_0.389961.p10 type:complete len:162 gc:universal NODE_130_length_18488_cov_0.389961:17153-16668(-)